MATQLLLYNSALRHIGETKLASLSEDRESRLALDDVWTDKLVDYALEEGYWHFAMRSAQFDADPTIKPNYGMANGFQKPVDWIRTAAICSDPFYNVPITAFADEAGFWFTDTTPIYARFVSNDVKYGGNLGAWPQSFTEFVACHMAWKIAPQTTGSEAKAVELEKRKNKLLLEARSKAAMNQSAAFPPVGSWVRGRLGRSYSYLDRGSQTQLIG